MEKLHVNLTYSIDSELRDYWFRKNCKHVHCRDGPVYDIKLIDLLNLDFVTTCVNYMYTD